METLRDFEMYQMFKGKKKKKVKRPKKKKDKRLFRNRGVKQEAPVIPKIENGSISDMLDQLYLKANKDDVQLGGLGVRAHE